MHSFLYFSSTNVPLFLLMPNFSFCLTTKWPAVVSGHKQLFTIMPRLNILWGLLSVKHYFLLQNKLVLTYMITSSTCPVGTSQFLRDWMGLCSCSHLYLDTGSTCWNTFPLLNIHLRGFWSFLKFLSENHFQHGVILLIPMCLFNLSLVSGCIFMLVLWNWILL